MDHSSFQSSFAAVLVHSGIENLIATAYRRQTNRQVEMFNGRVVLRLCHVVAELQTDWDKYVQPLTYPYNVQEPRSTGTTPIHLIIAYQQAGQTFLYAASAIPMT